jgi:hypothetical protein
MRENGISVYFANARGVGVLVTEIDVVMLAIRQNT